MDRRFQFTLLRRSPAFYVAVALAACVQAANAQQPVELYVAPPELVGGPWLNTSKNAPIRLAALKGGVTIVEFWTFG